MKNKKIIIGLISIILIIILIVMIVFIQSKQNENKAKQTLTDFISLINNKDYDSMYNKIVSTNISKEDFITRNQNIYEGIESQDIKIEIKQKQDKNYKIDYTQTMFTKAGEINFDNNVILEKENKEYKIKWASSFIFPQLADNQKVRISTIKAKRGDILDRNNVKLATDGTYYIAGIVPRKIRGK